MKRFRMKAYLLFTLFLGIFILPGCGGDAGNGHWDQPIVNPAVLSTSPAPAALGVPIGNNLTVTFNGEMDPATLASPATSFTVKEFVSNAPVSGVVTASGSTATFNPDADLLPLTEYAATINTGAMNLAGQALASDYVWRFTTGATVDTSAPFVSATSISDGATGLLLNIDITATFNEAMDPTTLTSPATSFTVKEFVSNAPVIGVVTYLGNTATFNPDADLLPLTEYISTVSTGAKDLAGIALTSGLIANPWRWTTGAAADIVAPWITITSPVDGDIEIPVDSSIEATFNEEMSLATMIAANFTVVETLSTDPVLGMVAYDPLTNIGAFTPSVPLKFSTEYTVTVTNGAQDLASNPLVVPAVDGLPVPNPWTFTTEAEVIIPPPLVNLGLAETFGIASTKGITNTITAPISHINGDVVFNPNFTCNAVDILFADGPGFGLCDGKAPTIVGTVITPLYPDTTTAQTITDALRAAYLSITPANMPGGTSIAAGTTLGAPVGDPLVEGDNLFNTGVYTSNTSILITGDLTLDAQGDPNATFVFQSASTIGTAPNSRILLLGGAKASNIWWQAGSAATLQSNTTWQGNILAYDDITMVTGATSCGRLFAGAFTDGAFVLDSNVVSVPGTVAGCE